MMSDNEIHKAMRDLGVEPGASYEEISERYKLLVRMWHSDRARPEDKAIADQELKKINNARDILKEHFKSANHIEHGYCRCRPTPVAAPADHGQASQSSESAPTDPAHDYGASASQRSAPPPPPPPPQSSSPPPSSSSSSSSSSQQQATASPTQASTPDAPAPAAPGKKLQLRPWHLIIFVGLFVIWLEFKKAPEPQAADAPVSPGASHRTVSDPPEVVRHFEPSSQTSDPRIAKNQAAKMARLDALKQQSETLKSDMARLDGEMESLRGKINTDYTAGLDTAKSTGSLEKLRLEVSDRARQLSILDARIKAVSALDVSAPDFDLQALDK